MADSQNAIANSILDTIGSTPMIRLHRLNPNPAVDLLAKVEGFNPTGSIKDRIALKMIENAVETGELTPGKTIIEPTSGNTGIGLAMVGALMGYPVEIVMSASVSVERREMISAFGAKVTLTAADEGTDGAIRYVRERLAENPDAYYNPNQFGNDFNKLAHLATAEEIWNQTGGKITHLVASLGTSGTLMGLALGLRTHNPDIQIIEAQPEMHHGIQGLKNMNEAIVPDIYDPDAVDRHIIVETEPAYECARRIVREEGIFVGMSSGAALYAAEQIAAELDHGCVVVIFPDRGEKYLSTPLFNLEA